jgi:hypothetical protein
MKADGRASISGPAADELKILPQTTLFLQPQPGKTFSPHFPGADNIPPPRIF